MTTELPRVAPMHRGAPFTLLGMSLNRKVHTGERRVSWVAVFILSLMWFTFGFHLFAGTTALGFTIQHYNTDPRVITLVSTLSMVFMLGFLISYLSDQIWTRMGRRRPFVLIAWLGGMLGMFSLAFFPWVSGGVNHLLALIGIPPVGNVIILAVIIFLYQKMYTDFAAPLEALFMECVPPYQRGRFFAIRGILFTLATMLFFQVFWPVYDDRLDMFEWCGHPGMLFLSGEQLIYLFAGALFLITGAWLLFCVEEVKVPDAANKTIREVLLGGGASGESTPGSGSGMGGFAKIPIIVFLSNLLKEVFLNTKNYPFYIIAVVPGLEFAVWGSSLGSLMVNDQFGYSKPNQALYSLPFSILSMVLVTPFAGWYSDNRLALKWRYRIPMVLLSGACMAFLVRVYAAHPAPDIRELPPLWAVSVMSTLIVLAIGLLYLPLSETLLDMVGRHHARVWLNLLAVILSMGTCALLYLAIHSSPKHILPITLFAGFWVVKSSFDALMNTYCAPMIFDYLPRNRMGTVGAGTSIFSNLLTLVAGNLGAWWVVYYTMHFVTHSTRVPGKNEIDYTSIYSLLLLCYLLIVIAKGWFLCLILTGRLKKLGEMEVENPEEAALLEQGGGSAV